MDCDTSGGLGWRECHDVVLSLTLPFVHDMLRIGGTDDDPAFLEFVCSSMGTFIALHADRLLVALKAFLGGFFMAMFETILGRRIFQQ